MAEPFLGEIRSFAFGVVPAGWAACNGQLLQVNQNQALFTLLGNTYGGDGKTNFALPNLQGRTPVHVGSNIQLGQSQGEQTHALTVNEMPAHTHTASASTGAANKPSPLGNVWAIPANRDIYASEAAVTMSPNAIATAGASQPHSNMQPYTTLSYCIAIQGIFPPHP